MPEVKQLQLQRPAGAWGPWLDLDDGTDVVRERLRERHGPYQLSYAGGDFGPSRGLPGTMDRLVVLLEHQDQGRVRIRDGKGGELLLRIGIWHTEAVPPPPGGITPSIAQAHTFIFTRTEELEAAARKELRVITLGYTVCKWINGVAWGTASQHCPGPPSPTGGNAMDWIIRTSTGANDLAAMEVVTAELAAKPFAAEVLWHYPDHYPNHAHVSGAPKRAGVPACLR